VVESEVPDGGVVLVEGALPGAPVLGAEPASGGFTVPGAAAPGLVEPMPLVEPLIPVPADGAAVDAPVFAAPPVAEVSLVATALVLAPVEAIPEPDHQSWLALCFGEARR